MAIVYFGDKFVDESEALVPVSTHALQYGTGVFEGIRSYGDGASAAIFRCDDHYRRFLNNAALLHMDVKQSAEQLTALTVELLQRNDYYGNTYIRPILYKSATSIGAHIYPGENLAIFMAPWDPRPLPPDPQTATIGKWRRISHEAVPAGAKICGLYVNSALAIDAANRAGFDQTVMLNAAGDVAEGYGANLFAVFGDQIITPPETADILPGITRDSLLQYLATRSDLTVRVETITPDRLRTADELFLCGTGLEVIPLSHLDGRPIGHGGIGPVTMQIAHWYRGVVKGEIESLGDWRTIVTPPA